MSNKIWEYENWPSTRDDAENFNVQFAYKQKRTYNTCNQTKSEALAVALGAWTALVKHWWIMRKGETLDEKN